MRIEQISMALGALEKIFIIILINICGRNTFCEKSFRLRAQTSPSAGESLDIFKRKLHDK